MDTYPEMSIKNSECSSYGV